MHLEEIEYGRDDSFSVSTYTSKPRQWRHLLERPFDKVTLLVTDDNRGKDSVHGEQSPTWTMLPALFRSKIEEVGETIGSDWLSYQTALNFDVMGEEHEPPHHHFDKNGEYDPTPKRAWYKSAEDLWFACVQFERLSTKGGRYEVEKRYIRGDDQGLSRRRIQTNHICFVWDLRTDGPGPATKLKGQRFTYTAEHAEALRKTDQLRKLKYENMWLSRYEVMSADGLVGEMGIRHPKRWALASEEYDEYYGITTHLKDAEDVESKGIGMKLTKARKPRSKKGKEKEEDGTRA
jgi:hypothetical protein